MDSKGQIYSPVEVETIASNAAAGSESANAKLKELMPLEPGEARELAGMNRAQRRAFYSNNRRKRPRFGGATKA